MSEDATRGPFVCHPRYGGKPRRTGFDPVQTKESPVFLHWHSPPACRIPATAIVADTNKQNAPTVPVTHYYDVQRVCRDCQRSFLFFAEEQRHWYEELGFVLDADCVHCPDCRHERRGVARLRARYEELHSQALRSPQEDLDLAELGVELIATKVFQGGEALRQKLCALLKRAASDPALRRRHDEASQRLRLLMQEGTGPDG